MESKFFYIIIIIYLCVTMKKRQERKNFQKMLVFFGFIHYYVYTKKHRKDFLYADYRQGKRSYCKTAQN